MPKVTEVSPQKKNPKRFNVFLDGQFAFGADEDLIVDNRLVPGKEIQKKDLEKLLFEAEVGKLMERVYFWFGVRLRSEKETRDYLKRLNFKRKLKELEPFSEIVLESLINRLKQKGLVNDLEFARAWFESRSRKKGSNIIKAELYKKGIDREIVSQLVSESAGQNQLEVAQGLLEKRLERLKKLPPQDQKRKAMDFLMRRGFDYSLVKDIVVKLIQK